MNQYKYNGIMRAIDASIKKWQGIVYDELNPDETKCPLCVLFSDKNCVDCPIKEQTGKAHCYGTSFYDTSVWGGGMNPAADYRMLQELYEVREAFMKEHDPFVRVEVGDTGMFKIMALDPRDAFYKTRHKLVGKTFYGVIDSRYDGDEEVGAEGTVDGRHHVFYKVLLKRV